MAYKPDKHGRDHCPGGEDPIPCLLKPWVILGEGATTAPNSTWTPIPFADIAYDPTLVTKGAIFDWTITDTGDVGNNRFQVSTEVAGWYEWELVTSWDQVTSPGGTDHGYAVQRITFDSTIGFPFDDSDMRNSADWLDNAYAPSGFEMIDNPWLRGGGKVFVPANKVWLPTAKQVTGASRGLSGVLLRIQFERADAAASWTFETV